MKVNMSHSNTGKFVSVALAAALLAACASPTVTQVVKPGDGGLNCGQMQNEFSDAQKLKKEADSEKAVTGGNVVRAIFFWPAIIGTAMNANEAISAADNRSIHLASLMRENKCEVPK